MAEPDLKMTLAAQRSHEDAKAANALYQAAGQAAILINGGASTAILTFATSDKPKVGFGHLSLAAALVCFAFGVVAGAFVIAFQAKSAQSFAVRWQNEVLGKREERVEAARQAGHFWGGLAQNTFVASALLFLLGALILSLSFKPQP
jgi:hypothetical protein